MASIMACRTRTTAARNRIGDALPLVAERHGIELPEQPPRHREPHRADAEFSEWVADVLETLATSEPGTPAAAKAAKKPAAKATE